MRDNHFLLRFPTDVRDFLDLHGVQNRKHIRFLNFDWNIDQAHEMVELSKECINLQEVRIRLEGRARKVKNRYVYKPRPMEISEIDPVIYELGGLKVRNLRNFRLVLINVKYGGGEAAWRDDDVEGLHERIMANIESSSI